MKVETTKYYCDVCGKEVEKDELTQYKLPMDYLYDGETLITDGSVEICKECRHALNDAIKKGFAQIAMIWCAGIKVKEVVYKKEVQKWKN